MVAKKRQSCNSSGYGVNGNGTSGVTLQVEADCFLLMGLATILPMNAFTTHQPKPPYNCGTTL